MIVGQFLCSWQVATFKDLLLQCSTDDARLRFYICIHRLLVSLRVKGLTLYLVKVLAYNTPKILNAFNLPW